MERCIDSSNFRYVSNLHVLGEKRKQRYQPRYIVQICLTLGGKQNILQCSLIGNNCLINVTLVVHCGLAREKLFKSNCCRGNMKYFSMWENIVVNVFFINIPSIFYYLDLIIFWAFLCSVC